MNYPKLPIKFGHLSNDPDERREQLIDLFGYILFDCRAKALEIFDGLINSEEARQKMGTIPSKPYHTVTSRCDEETLNAVKALCESSIDDFGKLLVGFLGQAGFSFEMDDRHVIKVRVDMEICNSENGGVVLSENINREGKKALASYWGRWLLNHSRRKK